ncbi:UNVERIFIED_CONTAM: Wall-associated receptor kinase [Sesamum angustifolium]|uniref:Wall-associated receptor kinase n=1 Tax=Sesamum angustifolium TaxID=2727405 RepID=A0AAW2JHD5_9LAMI
MQRNSTPPIDGIDFKAPTRLVAATAWPRHVPLGARGPLLRVRQADGRRIASLLARILTRGVQSNPAHGLKDRSGHALTFVFVLEKSESNDFYPSVPHEISVLVELILGHLRYLLTDVPPQPNSPLTMSSARSARRGSLGDPKRGASSPPPIHGISKITLKVVGISLSPFSAPLNPSTLSSHFTKSDIESSSTGSSFPADSAKSRSDLAVVSLDIDRDSGNLVNPFNAASHYPGDSGESLVLKLVAGIAPAIIILLLVAFLLYWEHKRRGFNKMKQKFFLQNGGTLLLEKLHARGRSLESMKIFTSFELKKATNDFNSNMIVGQGGFGTVYKGILPDNSVVAIKKSKRIDLDQVEQFINEVLVLSQINHRNVVRLLGCCLETEAPLLVYEFISNGTLSSHIHNQARARFFSWDIRLRIAAEAAGVLSYLHSAAATPIIHRDVKSDNILLDHSFTAKVSDFGASRLVPLDHTQLSTMVQGTFGYLDPEYMQTNQLTEKSDVYSFGVVLLELLTGRKAITFDKPEEEKNLANFFLSVLKRERLFQVLDDNILGDDRNIREQITEVARLAQGA